MNLLIKNVFILHSNKKLRRKADILIANGVIKSIESDIAKPEHFSEYDASGCFVSVGWCDTFCSVPDPGFEYKEDIESGLKTAMHGGFTSVAFLPDTNPVAHSKTTIEYWLNNSKNNLVNVLPLGAITQNCNGAEPAEMYDMQAAGAVAFSDAYHPITQSGILMRSLLYSLKPKVPVYSFPFDESLSPGAFVHEGIVSTNLGLKGVPSMAEELMVVRDINLAEYTGAHLHFPLITTAKSVALIKEAKAKGIQVTCGVSALHLKYTDETLNEFDSNWKIFPPLRSDADAVALRNAVLDGTIDVITSAHRPQNEELKKVEFEYAEHGIINLQTCYSLCHSAFGTDENSDWINAISVNGLKLLGQSQTGINSGEKANLTIFNPHANWNYTSKNNISKSANNPFLNQTLKGKVTAVFNNNQFQIL